MPKWSNAKVDFIGFVNLPISKLCCSFVLSHYASTEFRVDSLWLCPRFALAKAVFKSVDNPVTHFGKRSGFPLFSLLLSAANELMLNCIDHDGTNKGSAHPDRYD